MTARQCGNCWYSSLAVIGVVVVALSGCGNPKYPVTGKVLFKDGTPLPPGGMIFFSPADPANHTAARAYLEEDGSFTLSTDSEGDGSLVGKFRVSIKPPPQGRGEDDPKSNTHIIDPKYYSGDKSGIELEVKPGKNEFSITVERPAKGKTRG
jgi:hypothetical protein